MSRGGRNDTPRTQLPAFTRDLLALPVIDSGLIGGAAHRAR